MPVKKRHSQFTSSIETGASTGQGAVSADKLAIQYIDGGAFVVGIQVEIAGMAAQQIDFISTGTENFIVVPAAENLLIQAVGATANIAADLMREIG